MNNKQDFFKTDFYHIIFQVNKMAGHVPKKTMIVIGPTGVGKSTFCNVITGRDPTDNSVFPVSDSGESVTNKTSGEEIEWRGSGGFPVTLIDTPGLSDSFQGCF